MQLSAASSLSISSPIPRAFSPSQSTLSSCNSVFFNHGRKDLFTRNNSSARAMVMTRNRAQKGLSVRCLFGLGVPELAVIGGVALLLFGPKQIPEVGRTIGKTVKGFQQAAKEFETELKKDPEASSIVSSEEKPTANDEGEKQELEVSGSKESLSVPGENFAYATCPSETLGALIWTVSKGRTPLNFKDLAMTNREQQRSCSFS